jgi:hypothetical protein
MDLSGWKSGSADIELGDLGKTDERCEERYYGKIYY